MYELVLMVAGSQAGSQEAVGGLLCVRHVAIKGY
jgi:hypothetical protein